MRLQAWVTTLGPNGLSQTKFIQARNLRSNNFFFPGCSPGSETGNLFLMSLHAWRWLSTHNHLYRGHIYMLRTAGKKKKGQFLWTKTMPSIWLEFPKWPSGMDASVCYFRGSSKAWGHWGLCTQATSARLSTSVRTETHWISHESATDLKHLISRVTMTNLQRGSQVSRTVY